MGILRDPRIEELKRRKNGHFEHLLHKLFLKIRINVGEIGHLDKIDYETLDKYAKDVNAMIAEFLPKAEGWR